MADWTNPVYDRTQADVDYAKEQLIKGINGREYKGAFNVSDVIRIEGNARYLADRLFALYYVNNISTKHNWGTSSIPRTEHISRIIGNVGILQKAFYTPTGSVTLPTTLTHYEHTNAIEKNLNLLKLMIDDMESSFRECGTFECMEE